MKPQWEWNAWWDAECHCSQAMLELLKLTLFLEQTQRLHWDLESSPQTVHWRHIVGYIFPCNCLLPTWFKQHFLFFFLWRVQWDHKNKEGVCLGHIKLIEFAHDETDYITFVIYYYQYIPLLETGTKPNLGWNWQSQVQVWDTAVVLWTEPQRHVSHMSAAFRLSSTSKRKKQINK